MRKFTIIFFTILIVLGALVDLTMMDSRLWIYWVYGGFLILLTIAIVDSVQKKNAIRRNYPLFGNLRFLLRSMAPEIHQYFVEGNTDGKPFSKNQIDLVEGRAELKLRSHPFGTEENVYRDGAEWAPHSQFPLSPEHVESRILIGGSDCKQPYSSCILNISGMSYGALSKNAVLALNGGANLGNFSHNTGEGGLSKFHLQPGGDLVWQIGTGYFGCRTIEGNFSPEIFKEKAAHQNVKMIEIKLSQGAKPGHGGLLPAVKNTKEIAEIRGIVAHTTVHSPPHHTAFDGIKGLLEFVVKLRDLSEGKPIGFKLCIGKKSEFEEMCAEMVRSGNIPDFITVDAAEGGTGAAPLEFSNNFGMPGQEAVSFVDDVLRGYDLRDKIKVLYSGKVLSAFDIVRAIAAGADACVSARAMMFALGCIQALHCNNNSCPTGIATQKSNLVKGLDVAHKTQRVYNYHKETVETAREMIGALGLTSFSDANRSHIYQWSGESNRSIQLNDIYPEVENGSYLNRMKLQKVDRIIEK